MLDKIVRGYTGIINTIIVLLLLPIIGMASIVFGMYWIIYFPIWRWKSKRNRKKNKLNRK